MNSAHSSSLESGLIARTNTRRSLQFFVPAGVLLSTLFFAAGNNASADPAPVLTALQSGIPSSQIVSEVNMSAVTTGMEAGFSIERRSFDQRDSKRFARLTALGRTSLAQPKAVPKSPAVQSVVAKSTVVKSAVMAAQAVKAADAKMSVAPRIAVWKEGRRVAAGDRTEVQNAKVTRIDVPVATLPPASIKAQVAPLLQKDAGTPTDEAALAIATLPGLNSASQIVQVQALKLPPTSQPLPKWMQNVTVPMDGQLVAVPLPAAPPSTPRSKISSKSDGARVAQNPNAPPLRQPQRPVTSSDRLPNQVEVAASTYIVLVTKVDLATVAVADPNIADVAVVNARAILVNGKAPGTTTLVVVDRLGTIRQYQVRVVAAPGTRPTDIETEIGIEGVTVRRVQDSVILEGEVATAEEMKRALDIAGIFSTKVINQLRVRDTIDLGQLTALQIQEALNRPDVTVRVVGKTAILDGTVATESERQRAEQVARAYTDGEVLNLLRLPQMSIEELRELLGASDELPVVDQPYIGMAGQLAAPRRVVVRRAGNQVILEGVVATQADIDAAIAAASRTGLPIVNRLTPAPALATEAIFLQTVAQAIGIPGVRVRGTNKRVVLEGLVANTNVAVTAEQVARGFATEVDNQLQTTNPISVDVDVTFVEITNDDLKRMGFEFPSLQDASSSGFVIGNRSVNLDLPGSLPPTDPNSQVPAVNRELRTQTAFQAQLRAEATRGNARILSNPRTSVLSGRTATFQAGGQVPIPVSVTQTATGTTTSLEFKNFGILLDVIPNANEDGVITMRLRTEVSEPNFDIGFSLFPGASPIPGFVRRASVTEVTVGPGGTIALGGLITNTTRRTVTKVPILSKIPILGSLFTSKRFQNEQTELIIFVTPRVAPNPLTPGQTAPAAVTAAGNTTNVGTIMGNPGISSFSEGVNIVANPVN